MIIGREGKEKGGVSVEMFDSQRHDVDCRLEFARGFVCCESVLDDRFQKEAGRIGIKK